MTDIVKYYQNYFKNGGIYKLEDYKGSSRHLMFERWLRARLKPGAKILDIGCGDGTYSELMPEFQWTGIDINEEKMKYNGTRLVADNESFPYALEENSFDAVICSEVLEHLFNPDGVYQEVNRLLKKGGIYAISTPNFDWIEHHFGSYRQVMYDPAESHTKEHIRFYNLDSHKGMVEGTTPMQMLDFMGCDLQFGTFFAGARFYLGTQVLKDTALGEIDYILGRMFPTLCHTIGVLFVKH